MPQQQQPLLTIKDVAARLNCSRDTVYRLIHTGKLAPAFRLTPLGPYRIDPEAVERFLRRGFGVTRRADPDRAADLAEAAAAAEKLGFGPPGRAFDPRGGRN